MDAKLSQNGETNSDLKKPQHSGVNNDVANDHDDEELDTQVGAEEWLKMMSFMDW